MALAAPSAAWAFLLVFVFVFDFGCGFGCGFGALAAGTATSAVPTGHFGAGAR
ncbi:hypothetical protein ABZ770_01605 [Streptomyces sp. NPDC006654]|uniref:hypothetical protein n=1 Tax=Streptomyces sp. NPDC006654 TaxID=3156897 RepID=UPI0033DC07F6